MSARLGYHGAPRDVVGVQPPEVKVVRVARVRKGLAQRVRRRHAAAFGGELGREVRPDGRGVSSDGRDQQRRVRRVDL